MELLNAITNINFLLPGYTNNFPLISVIESHTKRYAPMILGRFYDLFGSIPGQASSSHVQRLPSVPPGNRWDNILINTTPVYSVPFSPL
jgi:hypothetical protein